MWLHPLHDADASCGGKAVGLARLIAAGLPVPEGFVVDDRAFRHVVADLDPAGDAIGQALAEAAQRIATSELPGEFVREVEARAARLGVLAVRSSATIEDGHAGAAAGVFSSRTGVPAADVWAAIRAVWTSALTPLAVTYTRRRGGPIAIGVIIQRYVPGELVTIYTRPPGAPTGDEVIVQRGTALERKQRSQPPLPVGAAAGADPSSALIALALHAEVAIGAAAGADVEIVDQTRSSVGAAPGTPLAPALWVVQARPIVHRSTVERRPAPPAVTAPLVADGRTWTWDVAHNPDPLSPAQIGLVEHVDRANIAPWSLRVRAGFLYAAPREDAKPHDVVAPTTIAALDARVHDLDAAMDAALVGATAAGPRTPTDTPTSPGAMTPGLRGDKGAPLSLRDAIDRYVAFYAIWATELAPLIAAARANLTPAHLAGARPSAVESTLLAAARNEIDEHVVLDRLGVMSPAWDVSVATFAERPELVRAAIQRAHWFLGTARAAQLVAVDPDRRDTVEGLHHVARAAAIHAERDLARAAADLAERDDVWFARAQWLVRAAILGRARELAIDPDDAFWIPLDELAAATALDARDVKRRASGARKAAVRAAQWSMPIVVGDPAGDAETMAGARSNVLDRAAPPKGGAECELRGVGTGPRVTGRVIRFETLASVLVVTAGDIVVTRAVTPALAVLVIGCAALVSETGGLLDHGAALARELGIPSVVGCRGAWQLTNGMVVTVDGDAGTVEIRTT